MYCKNCGAELTEQSNFCPYCGSAAERNDFDLLVKQGRVHSAGGKRV